MIAIIAPATAYTPKFAVRVLRWNMMVCVYSCDHYAYPEYRLGTMKDSPLASQVFSRTQVKFGYAKNETLPKYCWGECPKNRIIRTADGEPGLNYLCRGFKSFFPCHSRDKPHCRKLANLIRTTPENLKKLYYGYYHRHW